jgi:hypothetical protein
MKAMDQENSTGLTKIYLPKGGSMNFILVFVLCWFYIASACLGFRRLKRRFPTWHRVWICLAATLWPACLVFWVFHHSITRSVDWAEQLLDERISLPRSSQATEENPGMVPD